MVGIVVVGLALLLIWKLFTTISDRRELARFESETKEAKWDTVSIMLLYLVIKYFFKIFVEEEFEDTKGAIRIRKSRKDRQHNGKKKRDKRTNNHLQNMHIKLKIE